MVRRPSLVRGRLVGELVRRSLLVRGRFGGVLVRRSSLVRETRWRTGKVFTSSEGVLVVYWQGVHLE